MARRSQGQEAFDLAVYLVASARDCLDEPHIYGPLRLLEGVNKIIRMGEANPSFRDKFLSEKKDGVSGNILKVMSDRVEFERALDRLLLEFTEELKRRTIRK